MQSWFGLWHKFFSLDYVRAFNNLVYIGTQMSFDKAVTIVKDRNLLHYVKRNVYNCAVIGSKGSGKSAFLSGILHE